MFADCGRLSVQMEQLELRRKEEEAEREKIQKKKEATRDMFTRSIELAKQKRDKERHEELVCDMKLLEENLKDIADDTLASQLRKVPFSLSSVVHDTTFTTLSLACRPYISPPITALYALSLFARAIGVEETFALPYVV